MVQSGVKGYVTCTRDKAILHREPSESHLPFSTKSFDRVTVAHWYAPGLLLRRSWVQILTKKEQI